MLRCNRSVLAAYYLYTKTNSGIITTESLVVEDGMGRHPIIDS